MTKKQITEIIQVKVKSTDDKIMQTVFGSSITKLISFNLKN